MLNNYNINSNHYNYMVTYVKYIYIYIYIYHNEIVHLFKEILIYINNRNIYYI